MGVYVRDDCVDAKTADCDCGGAETAWARVGMPACLDLLLSGRGAVVQRGQRATLVLAQGGMDGGRYSGVVTTHWLERWLRRPHIPTREGEALGGCSWSSASACDSRNLEGGG